MVHSILNTNVNYPEMKKLDPDDKNYDASMYEITVSSIDIIIALGQAKYSFIENDIIYYPIYLVKDDKVNTQIGVYEILASQLPSIVDEDGDIELDKIDSPLLYKFASIDLLKTAAVRPSSVAKQPTTGEETEGKEVDDKEVEEDTDTTTDIGDQTEQTDEMLPEQTEAQSKKEMDSYIEDKTNPWIQQYLKSNEYSIIDNEGGGDCLFAVIRDALKSIDKEVSVSDLRKKLSDEATSELFDNYKGQYDMYVKTAQETEFELKEISKTINELKDRLNNSKNRTEQEKIVAQAKEYAAKHKTLKSENAITKELMSEFRFMKKVSSLDDFKKVIRSCDFWADTWAISTLERILNIKLIIFSSEYWSHGDKSNVILCGQLNDAILEKAGTFEPQYYMLLDYTGSHYKLVTYKHHRVFNFTEIPYNIKLLISNKCLERLAGPYSLIPQFRLFNQGLGVAEPINMDVEIIKEADNGLYNNDVVFQYYIKSNNKPLPGKGIGEKIPSNIIKDFSLLHQISDWRRKLDNEYVSVFELDGRKWNTVEHYYQASKFKNINKDFYHKFSLDSDSKISKDVDMAISAGSKTGKHKGELLRPKDIPVDPEFFGGNDEKVLEDAVYAKFSQNSEMKQLLLHTKNAKLLHYQKGMEPELSNVLMMTRNRIA